MQGVSFQMSLGPVSRLAPDSLLPSLAHPGVTEERSEPDPGPWSVWGWEWGQAGSRSVRESVFSLIRVVQAHSWRHRGTRPCFSRANRPYSLVQTTYKATVQRWAFGTRVHCTCQCLETSPTSDIYTPLSLRLLMAKGSVLCRGQPESWCEAGKVQGRERNPNSRAADL